MNFCRKVWKTKESQPFWVGKCRCHLAFSSCAIGEDCCCHWLDRHVVYRLTVVKPLPCGLFCISACWKDSAASQLLHISMVRDLSVGLWLGSVGYGSDLSNRRSRCLVQKRCEDVGVSMWCQSKINIIWSKADWPKLMAKFDSMNLEPFEPEFQICFHLLTHSDEIYKVVWKSLLFIDS